MIRGGIARGSRRRRALTPNYIAIGRLKPSPAITMPQNSSDFVPGLDRADSIAQAASMATDNA
jgi:hypothetical protein